ncbi:HAD-IA family hydrolase [Kiloniella sp. EL199]|uniref:HAD-IA family hydrolase n=1 Tax=Kiloniella sp. EL199 TaxID=2107581 RepID=UPI000EA2933A|nr:HAD-IA family hydrolase [Kiloniella sp. EL199]
MTKRNVLVFDLDGTLIESAPDLALSLQILLKSEGRQKPNLIEVQSMIGDGATKLVERGYAATGSALSENELKGKVKKFLEIYSENLVVETHLYENCRTVLSNLKVKGWKLLICTNKPYAPTLEIMNKLDLNHLFDKAVGGDSYAIKKPDPDHIVKLLDETGASTEQAIMIGDGVNDVLAAKNAQIPSILFTHGYGTEAAKAQNPDIVIDTFLELEDAINRLA